MTRGGRRHLNGGLTFALTIKRQEDEGYDKDDDARMQWENGQDDHGDRKRR